ncbi:MAG: LysM domain-containing protein [Candidatus Gastranaerophilales bacterium]|nr:LysM domain-containing protein [Candidatus Gastranaerophilales bacterium]
MKNTAQYKSNISREKLAVLEELLSEKQREYEQTASAYNDQNRDRELDILWQELKTQNKEERSPGVYLSVGFVVGALAMFLMTSIINFGVQTENTSEFNLWKKGTISSKKTDINVTPAGADVNIKNMKYKIKPGDTLESIALRYYGVTSPEKVRHIQNANAITNPHSIYVGQEITIPLAE